MKLSLLEILACPNCNSNLECHTEDSDSQGDVFTGQLKCLKCENTFPVIRGIPRFVPNEDYAGSFGFQWNQFRNEQLDSDTGAGLSRQRFTTETGWSPSDLIGMRVIEAGCGAGRFLEIVSESECMIVGVDISDAVEAAAETVRDRTNAHVIQASIFELPFKSEVFDMGYSIGVLQHTPDAQRAASMLPRVVRSGGQVAITVYERKPWTLLNGKYLIRPLTRRLKPELLLKLIKITMPLLFPITEFLFRIPLLGRLFSFVIPICDYTKTPNLNFIQRYRSVVLDTFDMLSPTFDSPMTHAELEEALFKGGISQVRRLPSPGLNLIGEKV